eukprot:g20203.t1
MAPHCSEHPDPKQIAEYLRGTKSSGSLKAVLRNEFEKIGRARITLGQIAEELREYRAKNIVGKAEHAGGWGDLKDPDTNKKIICTSRGEYNLEERRCVAAAKIKKSGKACKNYLVAIVTKMKIENKEKQQEKIIEKAKKREKELAMIKPEGAMMKGKVKIFADALKLSGDSGSWSSETLPTKIDAVTPDFLAVNFTPMPPQFTLTVKINSNYNVLHVAQCNLIVYQVMIFNRSLKLKKTSWGENFTPIFTKLTIFTSSSATNENERKMEYFRARKRGKRIEFVHARMELVQRVDFVAASCYIFTHSQQYRVSESNRNMQQAYELG